MPEEIGFRRREEHRLLSPNVFRESRHIRARTASRPLLAEFIGSLLLRSPARRGRFNGYYNRRSLRLCTARARAGAIGLAVLAVLSLAISVFFGGSSSVEWVALALIVGTLGLFVNRSRLRHEKA